MIKKILLFPVFNKTSGSGHLNRLIALAEQIENNFEIEFLFAEAVPTNFNYDYTAFNSKLNTPSEIMFIEKKTNKNTVAIVLDGYRFTEQYQKSLKQKISNCKIILVDDFTGKQNYADIIINHAPGVKKEQYFVPKKTMLLLGAKYFLIRNIFFKSVNDVKEIKNSIFICFGGRDEANWTKFFVKKFVKSNIIKKIVVVLGENYEHEIDWGENKKIKIYKELTSSQLINKIKCSEILIIPSSTLSLEVLVLNKKFVAVKTIENQNLIFKGLKKFKQVYPIDLTIKFDFKRIENWIHKHLKNPSRFNNYKNQTSKINHVINQLL